MLRMYPEIRSLKCPDKMSQKCSDIMEFWSDIDRNHIVFIIVNYILLQTL